MWDELTVVASAGTPETWHLNERLLPLVTSHLDHCLRIQKMDIKRLIRNCDENRNVDDVHVYWCLCYLHVHGIWSSSLLYKTWRM